MKTNPIENQVALVTGANRGIGKSIVEALLAQGVRKVYATARNPDSVDHSDDRVVPLALDLTSSDSVAAAAAQASDVEIVVNNGGVLKVSSPLEETAFENLAFEMDVNVLGLIRVAQSFAPILKANGGGALVQLNSVASLKAFSAFGTYSASKAASYSITQSLEQVLREQGTQLVSVHPGPIDTDMADTAGFTEGEPPSVVADSIMAALQKGNFHAFPDAMARQVSIPYQAFAENIVEADLTE
jgi:NAD(P)-dependent dehydrogenase (short-subunit alcohol dehydrogenase family)